MKPFNLKNLITVTNIKPGDYLLHGDVIIECIKGVPVDFDQYKKLIDNTLALGEATNHSHQLFGDGIDLRETPQSKEKYLRLIGPTLLRHQEHDQIQLPPGEYRIGIQREYDPFEKLVRRVAD